MTKEEIQQLAMSQNVQLTESQLQRLTDVLIPIAERKFKDMQAPLIEILKENGAIKLRVGYTIE